MARGRQVGAFGALFAPFYPAAAEVVEVPPASGIEASGIVIESPQLDPLLRIRSEGETLRMLREVGRSVRKRLRS